VITFAGTLPKLDNLISFNSEFLEDEVQDFLWKVKLSNPNLIFVFSDSFKQSEKTNTFKFFVGENYQYLKNTEIFVDFIKTIKEEYQLDITLELVNEDIEEDSYNIFLKKLIEFSSETNIVFVEYPKTNKTSYSVLGQLFGELAKNNKFNMALIANGHLSRFTDQSKASFDRRAKEIDDRFIEHLKVDILSIPNMNFYNFGVSTLDDGQTLQAIQGPKQNLYEGILILIGALFSSAVENQGKLENFEIFDSGILSGTRQLLSIFYSSFSRIQEYQDSYSIEEYLNLLIESKILKFNLNQEKIKLNIPKNFKKVGVFLNLYLLNQSISCFGDPSIVITQENIKQTLDILVSSVLNIGSKIRIKDLSDIGADIIFAPDGFNFYKIKTLSDLLKYDLFSIKVDKTEKYFFLKEKTIEALIKLFGQIKADPSKVKVFGLK
jgi:hypothetical protein